MGECSDEEDDTHLILHMSLPQKVTIRTIDTDVVLTVAKMAAFYANELWIASGTENNSVSWQFIILPLSCVLKKSNHFLCCTPLQVATRAPSPEEVTDHMECL